MKKSKKVLVKRRTLAVKIRRKILVKKKKHAPKKIARKKLARVKISKKRVKISKKRKAAALTQATQSAFFKAKIKVIGIGGGGGSIVSEIGRSLHKATFVVADTDSRAFKKRSGIKNFLFGQDLTHGLGTGLNTELAKRAAEQETEQIKKLFEHQDIVILVACLGGGLGSAATQVFADLSKESDAITFGIFTMPFKFEGKNKHQIAAKSLAQLRRSLNVSITIPNERIFKVIDENTAITQEFSTVNKSLIESLESLIDLIYSPGVINIDFADLRAILSGKGNMAFLNTAQAAGKDRTEKIIQDILHSPLYQHGNFEAQKVLFNIAGGGNLSMFEVDKISRAIGEKNPKAKIIFGISKHSEGKNKIKTTLLMTGPGAGTKAIQPEVALVVPDVKPPMKKKPKVKKVVKKKPVKKEKKQPAVAANPFIPVFGQVPAESVFAKQVSVVDGDESPAKKAIRRNALEVKKAEQMEGDKQSEQEKEWEIPAFLRLKK